MASFSRSLHDYAMHLCVLSQAPRSFYVSRIVLTCFSILQVLRTLRSPRCGRAAPEVASFLRTSAPTGLRRVASQSQRIGPNSHHALQFVSWAAQGNVERFVVSLCSPTLEGKAFWQTGDVLSDVIRHVEGRRLPWEPEALRKENASLLGNHS